jgi:hypothetical protein
MVVEQGWRSGRPVRDDIEQRLADLAGVSADDRARAAVYDAAAVPDQGRQPVSGRLGGQDAILDALQ